MTARIAQRFCRDVIIIWTVTRATLLRCPLAMGLVLLCCSQTTLWAQGPATITFDDLGNPNRNLNGQYPSGVANWGTNKWWLSGPWQSLTTNSISFLNANTTSQSFSWVTPQRLISVEVYNGGSGSTTITLSCANNPTRTQAVASGQLTTIQTNWSVACTTVTLGSSNGWWTNFDNLAYGK